MKQIILKLKFQNYLMHLTVMQIIVSLYFHTRFTTITLADLSKTTIENQQFLNSLSLILHT